MSVRRMTVRHYQEDVGAFDIVYAGQLRTKGGAAAEVFPIRGVEKTDVAIATRHTTATRSIDLVACGKNRVTVTFSGDPSTNHVINLLVVRPRRKIGAVRRVY